MFERILVPLDGSTHSHQALPYAVLVARCCSSELVLAHVTPQPASTALTPDDVAAEMGERPRAAGVPFQPSPADRMFLADPGRRTDAHIIADVERASDEVEALRRRLTEQGLTVRTVVRGGPPAETLLDIGREEAIELIVMSTHGRGGIGRFLLGSVADRVVRHADVPVMLVRTAAVHRENPEFKRIVVPLDGSQTAAAVLPAVRELARCSGAEIVLLRVVQGEPAAPVITALPPPEGVVEKHGAAEREATAYVGTVEQSAVGWGVPVRTLVQVGDPASVILDTAKDLYADLIVMSTHGLGGLRRFFLGSVAERVVRHAEAPVLVFRTPTPPVASPA
jgi:nucleotide-binding universal stress UspA family protein